MRTDDRLDRAAERPAHRALGRMSRTRVWLFGATLAVYVAIVVGVLTTSKLVTLDWQVMLWRPYKQWPQIHAFLDYFVVLGQRGPTAVMVLAWLGWRAWRHRTLHPLLVLGTSLLLLNITVGAVKYGLGRLGPHYATSVGSAEMFAGGDIFPSGHTANAVVTWGVLAYLATTPRARRWGSIASALLALGVGATTVYLGTHWVSDVLLGWAAGLLILLALPWFEPAMASAEAFLTGVWARRRRPRSLARQAVPAGALALTEDEAASAARHPLAAGSATAAASPAATATAPGANSPHAPGRPPTGRHERTPTTPAGSRRPPVERPRPAPPLVHQQAARGRGVVG
ncbi:phosphatase PAP2 family protein [Actinacidiphila bryophytorum]|uniref:phosphatase PAP2 family protein n=1 Tax=Actinacidiphila bryophytorum TaxID=1436133 RepID=UPI002176E861|nr:phosphatase PAP2 family protein [Actinacidiphila bryophytorum]UWE09150.1 phosphatase PAP2 family protein [Actinacidiphila bryophytorum]